MSLTRQLRRHAVELAAILGLIVAAIAVGGYVLAHQRLRFPWEHVYTVRADFTSAQAVTPGQGQTVAVAGVTVGEVSKVELHDGLARVSMEIDRNKLKAVHADARMLLRPKTGLQDMSVELDPGTDRAPVLGSHDVLPAARTKPAVNADEVLAALDGDTRTALQTLLQAGDRGLRGQGRALRMLFEAGAPTLEETRRVTDAIEARRGDLARLVHGLRVVAEETGRHDARLGDLVADADSTFGALAAHDAELRDALGRLPGTVSAARGALAAARPFAAELRPAADALVPAAHDLTKAMPALDPLLRDATPATRRIRGLVRDGRPTVADLRPAVAGLAAVTPSLTRAFDVANVVVNELAHNPDGPEEGYAFWTTWFFHNAASILSVEDAQGVGWRGLTLASCSTYAALPKLAPALAAITATPACPSDPTPGTRGR